MDSAIKEILDVYMPSTKNNHIAQVVATGLPYYNENDLNTHLHHLNRQAQSCDITIAVQEIIALKSNSSV